MVGSMVGAGIFTLPAAFGRTTGVLGAFVAWCIAGLGMLMLAFVFQTLSRRKPDLDAGIYAYARAGFGSYLGFLAAFGYWMACCLACLACLMLIKATLGQFIAAFGDGSTAVAIASGSLMLWGVHALVLRGVKQAAALNTIATVAKTVPIGIFIVVVIFAFRSELFTLNLWGGEAPGLSTVARQARDTMLLTVFVFVGIEGASVYSRYAKDRNDVGIATVLGFLGVLCLLMLVTLLSYGILPRAELAALPNPSMAGVMAAIVGPWGLVFISAGLVLSVAGNYLSWTLLAAEVLHSAAQNDTMPARLGAENAQRVPHIALWLTTGGDPGLPADHLVRRAGLHAGAEDDQRDDAAALPAGGGLRLQARLDRRDLCRRHPRAIEGPRDRRTGHAVRGGHAVGRRVRSSCCCRRCCTRRAPGCTLPRGASRGCPCSPRPSGCCSGCCAWRRWPRWPRC